MKDIDNKHWIISQVIYEYEKEIERLHKVLLGLNVKAKVDLDYMEVKKP